jgi:hypothetical protein
VLIQRLKFKVAFIGTASFEIKKSNDKKKIKNLDFGF